MITFYIATTRYSLLADGSPDRITLVKWWAEKVNDTVKATTTIRGTPIAGDYLPADALYDTITEADLIVWLGDLEDTVSIEAQLDITLAEIEHPTSDTAVPWQEQFDKWAVGVAYIIDDVRIYSDIGYQCIQAHTSQTTWAPPETPSLWTLYVPPSEGPQPWVQPTGDHDDYDLDETVTHNGHLWTSLVDANVWEPGVSQWSDEGVYP